MTDHFDVIVAGGGVAGTLAAARIAHFHPKLRIALIEKEPEIGGRLRTTDTKSNAYFSGFSGISRQLYDFIDQSLKLNPEAPDLPEFNQRTLKSFGVLAAGKFKTAPMEEFFSKRGARFLGGLAAQKEWDNVLAMLEYEPAAGEKRQSFGQRWEKARKHPSSIALEHISNVLGIPDLWNSGSQAVKERAKGFQRELINANWKEVLSHILDSEESRAAITLLTDCLIVGAQYSRAESRWTVTTEAGPLSASAMILAMPPWSAPWLHRDDWPATVHPMITKTKPVSVVTLTTKLVSDNFSDNQPEIPDLTVIPAESVQVYRYGQEVCFQATVDYEITLQAPAVVKGIKRLRRALKKLAAAYEDDDVKFEGEHLALIPVGWSQSPLVGDRRWWHQLEKDKHNSRHLAFAGDAYGTSCDSDENTVNSLLKACAAVTAGGATAKSETEPVAAEVIAEEVAKTDAIPEEADSHPLPSPPTTGDTSESHDSNPN